MKLKAIIVEDELASRETLTNYLLKYCPQVDLVGEADSVKSGLRLIESIKPDLVFLDVEMPFGKSFYPSATVTYSKVTVKNLDRIDIAKSKITTLKNRWRNGLLVLCSIFAQMI